MTSWVPAGPSPTEHVIWVPVAAVALQPTPPMTIWLLATVASSNPVPWTVSTVPAGDDPI